MKHVIRYLLLGMTTLAAVACQQTDPTAKHVARSQQVRTPHLMDGRRMDRVLEQLGRMIRAYHPPAAGELFVARVDLVPNNSGLVKELPADLAYDVGDAIAKTRNGFRFFPKYGSWTILTTPAGSAMPLANPPSTQPCSVGVTGELKRANEVVVDAYNARGNGQGSYRKNDFDLELTTGYKPAATMVRCSLRLTTPNDLSLGNDNATAEVRVDKVEDGFSFAVFVTGSGGGVEHRVTVQEDLGLAISDTIATCMVKLLGDYYVVPWYRLDPAFTKNREVDTVYLATLNTSTHIDLLRRAKALLQVGGVAVDGQWPDPTAGDSAMIAAAMRSRNLDVNNRDDLVKYVFVLWSELDYDKAATRVDEMLARRDRDSAETAATAAGRTPVAAQKQAAEPDFTPATFQLPDGTRLLVIDVRKITTEAGLKDMFLALRNAPEIGEIRYLQSGYFGAELKGEAVGLQQTLRRAFGTRYAYTWHDRAMTRLSIALDRTATP